MVFLSNKIWVRIFLGHVLSIWFVSFALKYSNLFKNMKCTLNSLRKLFDIQILFFSTFIYTESIRITSIQWRLRLSGSSVIARVFNYDLHCRTWCCLLCVFVAPLSYFTGLRLLTRAYFIGLCHCSYIFVPILAFRVHVACNWNQKILFVEGVLSTSFARALLGFALSAQADICNQYGCIVYCQHTRVQKNK